VTGKTPIGDPTAAAVSGPFHLNEVLTTLEVAQRLKLKGTKAILGAIGRGELVASLVGREYRILGEDANAYLHRLRTTVTGAVDGAPAPAATRSGAPVRRARRQPILGQGR